MAGILTLAGLDVESLTLHVGRVGAWSAALHMAQASAAPTGIVELLINGQTLRGTVDPLRSGAFLTGADFTVVAGANGWGQSVPAKPYHNDAFVGLRSALETTAAEVGETLSTTATERLAGVDYVRFAGSASRVLNDLTPDWYVDFDGLTYVVARAASAPAANVELESFDPRTSCGVFNVSGPNDLRVGAVVSADTFRLDATRTVRSVDLVITRKQIRAHAWLPLAS